MYKQVLDPIGNSLFYSSLVAVLPLLTLFLLLGVFKVRAWVAALVALAVSLVIAVVVYSMPVGQAILAGTDGAAFGFFPILWIVINAIWIYNMTVETGHFDVLRRSFARVSDDQRIQAVIIAFCFGALLEALAGFGTPVAITAVMLIALGFQPLKAATVALVANTAPVAFGALAIPIITLAKITTLSVSDLGSTVGRQTPVLAIFVPLALIFIVDGRRGLRQTWPAGLVCGVVFGLAQFATSNYVSVPLADIVASLLSALALVLFLRVWQPSEGYREAGGRAVPAVAGGSADEPTADFARRVDGRDAAAPPDRPGEVARAYAPYLIIIAIFVIANIPAIKGKPPLKVGETGTGLNAVTKLFNWPGLHVINGKGKPLSLIVFKLDWLIAAGTLLLIAGIITALVLRVSPARAVAAYGRSLRQLATAILTVMAVLALAFVMNASGQTATLGNWMAGAGGAFALLSPVLGWLGVAVTGSDTSSNSLFGALQVTAATKAHLSPVLMASGNSSGGVLGKMISPQNLAIAAAAVGLGGREGELFRRVIGWSILFLLLMCVLVYLQSTSVLSWMV
ncbi:MAG: L-lactate permease [Actinomycetota bacterium]|nr:L-lactate permease [Actinomycetota bacterium]